MIHCRVSAGCLGLQITKSDYLAGLDNKKFELGMIGYKSGCSRELKGLMLSSRTQVFLSFFLAILGLTVWLPVGQPGQPQAYGQSGENLVEGKGCCLEVSLRKPFQ